VSGRRRGTGLLQSVDDDDDLSGSGKRLNKPIITITTDTPAPSPASRSPVLARMDRRDSQLSSPSRHHFEAWSSSKAHPAAVTNAGFPRSMTDSTINYSDGGCSEAAVEELPGSACYVTADGQMDYQVQGDQFPGVGLYGLYEVILTSIVLLTNQLPVSAKI